MENGFYMYRMFFYRNIDLRILTFFISEWLAFGVYSCTTSLIHADVFKIIMVIILYFVRCFLLGYVYRRMFYSFQYNKFRKADEIKKDIPFNRKNKLIKLSVLFLAISLPFLIFSCGVGGKISLTESFNINEFLVIFYPFDVLFFNNLFPSTWPFAVLYLINFITYIIPVLISVYSLYKSYTDAYYTYMYTKKEAEDILNDGTPKTSESQGIITHRDYLD